ncbi:Tctex-1 [Apodospora peruviana]|uniref:Tctex-1 n=1 Tax=Apodospora peruviana TaxID=516989 RepID=A0AAE0I1R1_9PEZI|nr:Tctex-1 [Apodospora peruviana]
MEAPISNSPLPLKRLEQIATDACNSALTSAEYYDHPKTAQWNQTIIQKMLKAVMSEAMPEGGAKYKFAINSTIVQHVVPNSQLNKSSSTSTGVKEEDSGAAAAAAKKGQAGRRGMHSATGGYWNEKTDGMWSFKFDGEAKGLDVVIMLIWIAV